MSLGKPPFITIPISLISPKWNREVGATPLTLYLYLCALVETDHLYRHADASEFLGLAEGRIRRWFGQLVKNGCISVRHTRYGTDVHLNDPRTWGQEQPPKQRSSPAWLLEFNRLRPYVVARDDYRCGLCGGDVDPGDISIDHIIPRSKGGPTTMENLQVVHRVCNSRKGNRV